MEEMDSVLQQRLAGNERMAGHHLENAYRLEAEAANGLFGTFDAEPTRSVLYRSAATLARDCGQHDDAEKLIHRGLSGNPPAAIARELRDLLEEVTFARHLELRGVELGPDELQMAITGQEVGFGIAPTNILLTRIHSTENLLYRTAERKLRRAYRDRGRRDNKLSQLYVTVPRAASLAVTFRIGSLQNTLPGVSPGEGIVDEFLTCLELFTSGAAQELQKRIEDEAYYRNFVGLAQNLQPDGAKVNMVGFTALRDGRPKQVAMRKRNENEPLISGFGLAPVKPQKKAGDPVRIKGELQFADITSKSGKQSNEIKIATEGNVKVTVVVPPGMMDDIVKPLWRAEVEIVGEQRGKKVYLAEIKAVDPDGG